MIVASGFIEVHEMNTAGTVINELKKRDITVDDLRSDRIFFLIERENIDEIRHEIHSLNKLKNVKNVHLTYYSMENVNGQSDAKGEG